MSDTPARRQTWHLYADGKVRAAADGPPPGDRGAKPLYESRDGDSRWTRFEERTRKERET